jgi:hypothetical protein
VGEVCLWSRTWKYHLMIHYFAMEADFLSRFKPTLLSWSDLLMKTSDRELHTFPSKCGNRPSIWDANSESRTWLSIFKALDRLTFTFFWSKLSYTDPSCRNSWQVVGKLVQLVCLMVWQVQIPFAWRSIVSSPHLCFGYGCW